MLSLNVTEIAQQFRPRTPIKWIAGYMLFSAIGLSVVYLSQSTGFIFTGQLPSTMIRTGHPTSIIFALDLTLLIPVMILGAIWLLQRKPWGYVLAGISTVKGTAYTLVLTSGSLWAEHSGMSDVSTEIPIWVFLTAIKLIANVLLFRNMNAAK